MTRKTSAYGRKLAQRDAWQQERAMFAHPVTHAMVRVQIQNDIARLRTAAGLHTFMGGNEAMVVNLIGRLTYIVCHAARAHGLDHLPEARILASTVNVLGDMRDNTSTLDQQRATLIAGLAAADRLLPQLSTMTLADGALELDALLASTHGLNTSDVARALAGWQSSKAIANKPIKAIARR